MERYTWLKTTYTKVNRSNIYRIHGNEVDNITHKKSKSMTKKDKRAIISNFPCKSNVAKPGETT